MAAIKKRSKGALSVREGGGQAEGAVVSFSGSAHKVRAPAASKARSRSVEEGIAWTRQVDKELKAEVSRLLKAGELDSPSFLPFQFV